MKKYLLDLTVTENRRLNAHYVWLKLTAAQPLPPMRPGQFAQLRVDGSPATFLRRPISIHYVDRERNEVWFLIQLVGEGTKHLGAARPGDVINTILPLGNGFTLPDNPSSKTLLVGGGAGIAPMLYLGSVLAASGCRPAFLLGARTAGDLLQLDCFAAYGSLYTTTEDGSHGERGFVTAHSILQHTSFDRIYACGPKPMMQAVAACAKQRRTACEVSLENMMACGVGACLCCVEHTVKGHVCVCKEGPVFDINQLLWPL